MEQLLNSGSSISDLAFLRILQMIHRQTSQLVEDLKHYELPSTTPRSPIDDNEFNRTLSSAPTPAGAATSTSVTGMLESAMEELFVPYLEGQKYLERESRSLTELYVSFLTNFTKYHVSHSSIG